MTLENTYDTIREEKSKSLKNEINIQLKYLNSFLSDCSVIEQLDGKGVIMSMLTHEDTQVRHQALLCVQKLMVHNW
jgi:hypothetical protein